MGRPKHALDLEVFRVDPRDLGPGDLVAVSTGRGGSDIAIRCVVRTGSPGSEIDAFRAEFCCGESASWETVATDEYGNWEAEGYAVRVPRETLRTVLERARSDMAFHPGHYHELEVGAHALDLPELREDPTQLEPGDFVAFGTDAGYRLQMVAAVDVSTDTDDTYGVRFCGGDVETWPRASADSSDEPACDGEVIRLSAGAVTFQLQRANDNWLSEHIDPSEDSPGWMGCPFCGALHTPQEPCDG